MNNKKDLFLPGIFNKINLINLILNGQGFVQEEKELVGTTCSLSGMGRDGIPNFLTLITKRCSTKRKKWRKPSLGWLASVFSPITGCKSIRGCTLIAGYKSSLFRWFLTFSEKFSVKLPQFHKNSRDSSKTRAIPQKTGHRSWSPVLVTSPGHWSWSPVLVTLP